VPILKICLAYLFATTSILVGCQASKKIQTKINPDIYQYWIHSHEDDIDGLKVYRPKGYDFPASRGRVGLDLKSDGSYIEYRIGANDVPVAVQGKFTVDAEGKTFTLTPMDASKKTRSFEVVSVGKEMLKIKWDN